MGRTHPSTVEMDVESPWRLVMIGALVLVTCDPQAAPPVEAVSATSSARVGYAPTTVGDTWTYQTTQSSPGLAMPGATSTDRILSSAQEGERRVARVVSEDAVNKAANSERSVIVTAAGLSPDIGVMTTGIGPVKTVKTGGIYLPDELTPGKRWSWTQALDSPISTMEVAGSAEVVGPQQVTVPAGTFDAVLVRSETRNHVVTKGGAVPPIDHVQHDDAWWVRGLGLVKSVTTAGGGYSATKVLIRYSVQGAPAGQATAQVARGEPQAP